MIVSTIPQFPNTKISISFFEQVENAEEIRSKMSDLSTSFAFVDPKLICSQEQIYSAIYKTLIEVNYNKMRTRNLNSECVLCLSPTSNISDAFQKFGIKDDSTELICLKFHNDTEDLDKEQLTTELSSIVTGVEIGFNDKNLSKFYDETLIRKVCSKVIHCDHATRHTPLTHYTNFFFISPLFYSQVYKLNNEFKPKDVKDLSRALVNAIQLRGI